MIKLLPFKPEVIAWRELDSTTFANNKALDSLELKSKSLELKSEQAAFNLLKAGKANQLTTLDLLLVINSEYWNTLKTAQAESLADLCWSLWSKNMSLFEPVYIWFFNNQPLFHSHLIKAAGRCKTHPKHPGNCIKGHFEDLCNELLSKNIDPDYYCKNLGLPLFQFRNDCNFQRALARCCYSLPKDGSVTYEQRDAGLLRILDKSKSSEKAGILTHIIRLYSEAGRKTTFDPRLVQYITDTINPEYLTNKTQADNYHKMIGQHFFEYVKTHIDKLDDKTITDCGFRSQRDKENGSDNGLSVKRWFNRRLDFAKKIQYEFKFAFVLTSKGYNPIIPRSLAPDHIFDNKEPGGQGVILLLKQNGCFLAISLPSNNSTGNDRSAIIGQLSRPKFALSRIKAGTVSMSWLTSRSATFSEIPLGDSWQTLLTIELQKQNILTENITKNMT